MIIQEINESDFLNLEFLGNLLTETTKSIIPQDIKKFMKSESNRNGMLQEFGDRAFLQPEKTKYPVINHKTGDYDCRLIYCARIRARQAGDTVLAEQADALFEQTDCTKKVNIKLHEHDDTYDLVELMNLLEIQFEQKEEEDEG